MGTVEAVPPSRGLGSGYWNMISRVSIVTRLGVLVFGGGENSLPRSVVEEGVRFRIREE